MMPGPMHATADHRLIMELLPRCPEVVEPISMAGTAAAEQRDAVPRALRSLSRRTNCRGVVRSLEERLRERVETRESDWVLVETRAPTPEAAAFERFWIHRMAAYYGMQTHSMACIGVQLG